MAFLPSALALACVYVGCRVAGALMLVWSWSCAFPEEHSSLRQCATLWPHRHHSGAPQEDCAITTCLLSPAATTGKAPPETCMDVQAYLLGPINLAAWDSSGQFTHVAG